MDTFFVILFFIFLIKLWSFQTVSVNTTKFCSISYLNNMLRENCAHASLNLMDTYKSSHFNMPWCDLYYLIVIVYNIIWQRTTTICRQPLVNIRRMINQQAGFD